MYTVPFKIMQQALHYLYSSSVVIVIIVVLVGRIKVLQKWKEKKGINATYSALLRIFLRVNRADLARDLINLWDEG